MSPDDEFLRRVYFGCQPHEIVMHRLIPPFHRFQERCIIPAFHAEGRLDGELHIFLGYPNPVVQASFKQRWKVWGYPDRAFSNELRLPPF